MLSSYVDGCKDEMFNGGAQIIVERLKNVAESIGKVLTEALEELAVKVGSFLSRFYLILITFID